MPEYIEVRVGASTWRVGPGSIGEALARYAARRYEPGGDLYPADVTSDPGTEDAMATDGAGMYAAGA